MPTINSHLYNIHCYILNIYKFQLFPNYNIFCSRYATYVNNKCSLIKLLHAQSVIFYYQFIISLWKKIKQYKYKKFKIYTIEST